MVELALGLDLVVFFLGLLMLALVSRAYRDDGATRSTLLGMWMSLLWIAVGLFGLAESARLSSGVATAVRAVAVALGLVSFVYGYKGWTTEAESANASDPDV